MAAFQSVVFARADSLRREILRVARKDHPFSEPAHVFAALVAVLDRKVARCRRDLDLIARVPPFSDDDCGDQLEALGDTLDVIYETFSRVLRVDSPRIPFELVRPLSLVATALLGTPCRVIIRLHPSYNYSIDFLKTQFAVNHWTPEWQEHLVPLSSEHNTPEICLIGFPSAEAEVVLMHVLAAHEFAHHLAKTGAYGARLDLLAKTAREHAQDVHQGLVHDVAQDHQGNQWWERLSTSWVEETFADLVATRLVGPAYLAALERLGLEMEGPSLSHPPSFRRRQAMAHHLEKSFPHVARVPEWKAVLKQSAAHSATTDRTWELGLLMLDHVVPDLEDLAATVLSPLSDAKRLADVQKQVEECFKHLCPPNDYHLMSSDRARETEQEAAQRVWLLFYTAWQFRLGDSFGALVQRHGQNAEAAFSSLLVHSLMSLELKHSWRTQAWRGSHAA